MRLIDADKLKKKFQSCQAECTSPDRTEVDWCEAVAKMFVGLNNAPTIHTENKKGRWIADRYCSECEWDKKDAELVCNIPTNYCPNCGADMRSDNK